MKNYMFWFCHIVARLDRIPRYGRLYKLSRDADGKWDFDNRICEWRYQRHGYWGLHILTNMGLFWAFQDELERWAVLKIPRSPGSPMRDPDVPLS